MRWGILIVTLIVGLSLPGLALAGGGGNVGLSRAVGTVEQGMVPVYFQVLQHGNHPVAADRMTVVVTAPGGAEHRFLVKPDPAFGADYVYRADIRFDTPGKWRLDLMADHAQLRFPTLTKYVTVEPAGSGVTLAEDLRVYERGAGPNGEARLVFRPVPAAARSGAPLVLAAGGGTVAAAALVGAVLLWRRRKANV